MLIRSGEALGIGWSRNMLYSGFNTLLRSVVRRQTGFAARITRTLCGLNEWMPESQFRQRTAENCWEIHATKTIRLQQNDKKRTSSKMAVQDSLGSLFHRTVAALQTSPEAPLPRYLRFLARASLQALQESQQLRLQVVAGIF